MNIIWNNKESKDIELGDVVRVETTNNVFPACLVIYNEFNKELPYILMDMYTSKIVGIYRSIETINSSKCLTLVCKAHEVEVNIQKGEN